MNLKHTTVYMKIRDFDSEGHHRIISVLKRLALPENWFIEEEILVDDEDSYSIIQIKDKFKGPYYSELEERDVRLKRASDLLSRFDESIIREIKEIDQIIFLAISTEQESLRLDSNLIQICAKTGVEIYLYFSRFEM
jgi:hypothetical protein